jgi:hypothetical protein
MAELTQNGRSSLHLAASSHTITLETLLFILSQE